MFSARKERAASDKCAWQRVGNGNLAVAFEHLAGRASRRAPSAQL
jgi:hypothetical protein